MLSPKKLQFNKLHRRDSKYNKKRSARLVRGLFGLKSLSYSRLTSQQLESARRAMTKKMNRIGKIFLRTFPSLPVTKKPLEIRMGKGKGSLSYWCYPVKIGEIIFEFQGISQRIAEEVGRLGASKLPVQVRFVKIKQKN